MRVIRNGFIVLCLVLGAANAAVARVNVDINFSLFPELVPVPGYPVYYAPGEDVNYFFYDGMYWVYEDDDWYVSDWYNGPWEYVDREYVPVFILRIPVRYYRRPPVYFRGWVYDEPPRWGQRWGYGWERNHRDWNHWDHRHSPAPAPLPDYQRHYSHDRYPDRDEQRVIRDRSNYRYQPKDMNVQPRYRQSNERAPEQRDRDDRQDDRNRHEDSRERAKPQSDGWQGSSQRRRDSEQSQRQPQQQVQDQQEQREHNVQRRIPVIESPRGQQNVERNSSPEQGEGRGRFGNPHSDRQQQEQRQPAVEQQQSPRQQPNEPQQRERGRDQGRDQRGDKDARQDDDHGGRR